MTKDISKKYSVILTIIGTMITAFSISTVLNPNKVVSGGASGISIILNNVFGLPLGITFALINIVLLAAGYKILGREFTLKTIFGAGLITLFVQLFSYIPPITDNIVLASVFGGVLYGLGIGLTLSIGATTGGTDVLGRLIQYFYPDFPIGKLLLVLDGTIIFISLVVFRDTELVLFGILALFVSTYSIDYFIRRLNISTIAFVITEKGSEISHLLVSTSPRGITLINVTGAFTNEEKNMLFCALKASEVAEFQKKIHSIDPDSFIVFAQSQQIVGNGFYVYR